MTKRILVTCRQMQAELPSHIDRLVAAGYEVSAPAFTGQQFSSAELLALMPNVVGVIAGDDEIDSEFFVGSSDLRVLVRWGIGMDSVDRAAAARQGVVVRNTPGVFGGEVADSAWGYLLLLARGHHLVDAEVRHGGWPKYEGVSLASSSLGIVGLGDIGRAVASRGLGFDMEVRAFDPYVRGADVPERVMVCDGLSELLSSSRFVVLTCPLTAETFHLINDDSLSCMAPDSFLINVARGSVVDEVALVSALERGVLAGAGLDVFETEPLPADSPLRSLESVVLGAHNGSNTREAVARASSRAVDILLTELAQA